MFFVMFELFLYFLWCFLSLEFLRSDRIRVSSVHRAIEFRGSPCNRVQGKDVCQPVISSFKERERERERVTEP